MLQQWTSIGVGALVLLFLCVFSGAGQAAAGPTLYVNNGSALCADAGPATFRTPLCTIGAAAARVRAGETVRVAPGTYAESVTLSASGTRAAPIVFAATRSRTVRLRGGANGFRVARVSWIRIEGFTITGTSAYGIEVSTASRITLTGNHVSLSGKRAPGKRRAGIRLRRVTDSLVARNAVEYNSDSGIVLTEGSTRNVVRANRVFANARGYERAGAGIRLYASPSNVVASNVSYGNEDSGIELFTGSGNTLVYNNVTYANGDHGIDSYRSPGQAVVANTVYGNVTSGINVEGASTAATIGNNIAVDNGINSPRGDGNIRVDDTSTPGTTMDHNLVYLSERGSRDDLLVWDSVGYGSLDSFQKATGHERHGIERDPRWRSPARGDFRLLRGSPAIDSADSSLRGAPARDASGRGRFDDPASENRGRGRRSFDDRGAYERTAAESRRSR